MTDQSMLLKPVLLASMLSLCALLSGCFEPDAPTQAQEPAPALAPPPAPTRITDYAEFKSLSPLNNAALSDLEGKVVYVDFWASWCAPCIYSLPILNDIRNAYHAQGYGDAFEIVSVNVDTDADKIGPFMANFEMQYPMLRDDSGALMERYDVTALPTGVLINAAGESILVHRGFAPGHDAFLKARIELELRRRRLLMQQPANANSR